MHRFEVFHHPKISTLMYTAVLGYQVRALMRTKRIKTLKQQVWVGVLLLFFVFLCNCCRCKYHT